MFDGFLKECRITVRSITYVIFCAALVLMFCLQYLPDVNHDLTQAKKGVLFEETMWGGTHNNLLVRPEPGMAGYGAADDENPDQVMRYMTYRLYRDIASNRYDTYHLGLIRTTTNLKFAKQQKILDVFEKITGKPLSDLDAEFYKMDINRIMTDHPDFTAKEAMNFQRAYYKQLRNEFSSNEPVTKYYNYQEYITVDQNLTYSEYQKYIAEARKIIRGQSDVYSDFAQYGSRPYTYDEALALHETMVEQDHVSGAYARLFCDKMGIIAGLFPVFGAWAISVGGVLRKSRSKQGSSLEGSGLENVWNRFFAMSAMAFLPVLVLAIIATIALAVGIQPLSLSMNPFAFIAYSVAWLLPTILFTVSEGLFFFILTRGSAGVFVQIAVWYLSMLLWTDHGMDPVKYGTNMFLRHGVVGEYDIYASSFGTIVLNRIAYTLIALALIAAAKFYEEKSAVRDLKFSFRAGRSA